LALSERPPALTAYGELFETLEAAAWIFENEKDGRFQGCIMACRAVARFIKRKGRAPQLASPFLHIAEAFADLEKGGNPNLFSKKTAPEKVRDRSPERKHLQIIAGIAVELLATIGTETVGAAAARVARSVRKWPGMRTVTAHTVLAWRKQHRKNHRFVTILQEVRKAPNPLDLVNTLLREGPKGMFK
jgi:hypothetical protein